MYLAFAFDRYTVYSIFQIVQFKAWKANKVILILPKKYSFGIMINPTSHRFKYYMVAKMNWIIRRELQLPYLAKRI